ncbi:Glycosyl transferase family 2 [Pseudobutyrivibrio ruminis DSM 9787]|uniref:Glycosyl transferase family 2 n=2 Tax=Pseudobutyrivibrio ruminis TaxID=46206 RepID=A0A285S8M7_9FIRM|nr:Glycosyl transferase family 2 [Pseudobutyrivibrio ruminis DSM 9787]
METLYIVMPAYNEEDNIKTVVEQWYPLLDGKSEDSRLVIADSGSNDKTHEILMNLSKTNYPKIEILSNTNQYHGPKVIALYDYAIKNGADYIFQTDSDGQTNPDEFAAFWNERNRYDGIFGNRVIREDGNDRAFVEHTVCALLKIYFGVRVPDANAPFRLMKAETVKKYLYRMSVDYNLPNIMLTTWFSYYNENISFKEISFKPRQAGVNSINIPKIVKIGFTALGDFRRFKKNMG